MKCESMLGLHFEVVLMLKMAKARGLQKALTSASVWEQHLAMKRESQWGLHRDVVSVRKMAKAWGMQKGLKSASV